MTTIRNIILLLAVLNRIFGAEGVADMTHNGFSLSPLENRINFIIPDYQLKENTIGGVDYSKPEIEGAGSIAQPGQPDLPSVSTYYMVEPGKTFDVQYTIEDYEVIDNIKSISSEKNIFILASIISQILSLLFLLILFRILINR